MQLFTLGSLKNSYLSISLNLNNLVTYPAACIEVGTDVGVTDVGKTVAIRCWDDCAIFDEDDDPIGRGLMLAVGVDREEL